MQKLDKDFKFKKQFGQNFIFDTNFLLSVVKSLNLDKKEQILEIGAGAGTLTEILAQNFSKVISVEIDKTLKERLLTIEERNKNLHFVFDDILNIETSKIDEMFNNDGYYMIANLPYYITSQIIFKFLLESYNIKKMFVMVQKEVGERFCAKSKTKEYGIPSVLINTFGSCKIIKQVGRHMFTPQPNVDSCIIEIDIDRNKYNIKNVKEYNLFISNCFQMKRKTLYNNLIKLGCEKDKAFNLIEKLGLSQTVRPEELDEKQFVELYICYKNC